MIKYASLQVCYLLRFWWIHSLPRFGVAGLIQTKNECEWEFCIIRENFFKLDNLVTKLIINITFKGNKGKSIQMTHITSGLVNRKYKAAAVAPVAANVMMPIRGISCNARFQGRCYLRILHPAHPKSLLNVKNEHKNLPPSSSSTFAKIQPSLIFTIFEKQEFYFHSMGLEFRSRGWRQRVRDAAACDRRHLLRAKSLQVSGLNIR